MLRSSFAGSLLRVKGPDGIDDLDLPLASFPRGEESWPGRIFSDNGSVVSSHSPMGYSISDEWSISE